MDEKKGFSINSSSTGATFLIQALMGEINLVVDEKKKSLKIEMYQKTWQFSEKSDYQEYDATQKTTNLSKEYSGDFTKVLIET